MEQIHTEEDLHDCISRYCQLQGHFGGSCPYQDQISSVTLSYLDARGPAFARTLQQHGMRQEEFCMQVDAHSDVVSDWDMKVLNIWGSVNNEFAILSTTPPDVKALAGNMNLNDRHEVPHLCQGAVTEE